MQFNNTNNLNHAKGKADIFLHTDEYRSVLENWLL